MNVLNVNNIELAFDSFGDEAGEAILLISGLGTQMIRWTDPFCQELATRGYRVIRFDNRDAGCSTHFTHHGVPDFHALTAGKKAEAPYTLYDMADDAVSLLDSLSVDRAHVVGRSMGGMMAQIMASEHPERVLSLTSIMSSTGNPALPQAESDVMAMMMRRSARSLFGPRRFPVAQSCLCTPHRWDWIHVRRRRASRPRLGRGPARL
jgi:pimeloyl-ACP methyl ester carboxylesterase